jgi:hypothetical protein
MAGRRKNGAGTIRECKDGRWEGRIIIGYDDNGKAKTKSVFAPTKTECAKKLKELQNESYHITGRLPTQAKSSMSFGEWMDLWYQNYCKQTIRETTRPSYENRIYQHIIPEIGRTDERHEPVNNYRAETFDLGAVFTWRKNEIRYNRNGRGIRSKPIPKRKPRSNNQSYALCERAWISQRGRNHPVV